MKKFLGHWTLFEILFLIFSEIAIILCFVFSVERNVFSLVVSLIGVISVLMVAKGLTIAPIINIFYNIIYSILAITEHYYGEAIIYLGLMIPISVLSIISWFKNKNKESEENVQVNTIKGVEYLYLSLETVVATIAFYFILKVLNTSELIVSTLSLVSSAVASYLMLRRSSYYALGFVANDIILIALWGLAVVNSGVGFLPSVICFVIFLINDIYGFIHWKIEEKKQKNQGKTSTQ